MSQSVDPADSRIVMAEQNGHDVVNRTLSGGEPSPSDVPASTNDKTPAGGDVGEIKDTATTTQPNTRTNAQENYEERNVGDSLQYQKDIERNSGALTTTVRSAARRVAFSQLLNHNLGDKQAGPRTGRIKSTRDERTDGFIRRRRRYRLAGRLRIRC